MRRYVKSSNGSSGQKALVSGKRDITQNFVIDAAAPKTSCFLMTRGKTAKIFTENLFHVSRSLETYSKSSSHISHSLETDFYL